MNNKMKFIELLDTPTLGTGKEIVRRVMTSSRGIYDMLTEIFVTGYPSVLLSATTRVGQDIFVASCPTNC